MNDMRFNWFIEYFIGMIDEAHKIIIPIHIPLLFKTCFDRIDFTLSILINMNVIRILYLLWLRVRFRIQAYTIHHDNFYR